MKTTQFGSLKVEIAHCGTAVLKAYSPVMGHFELPMSADELLLFLVEAGNGLSEARREERRRQQERELLKEKQR